MNISPVESFAHLEDGWLGKSSKAPDKVALAKCWEQWVDFFPQDFPPPDFAPTAEGGLFAEWVHSDMRVSVEILLPSSRAELLAVNVETGQAADAELDLDTAERWSAMYEFVRQHLPVS